MKPSRQRSELPTTSTYRHICTDGPVWCFVNLKTITIYTVCVIGDEFHPFPPMIKPHEWLSPLVTCVCFSHFVRSQCFSFHLLVSNRCLIPNPGASDALSRMQGYFPLFQSIFLNKYFIPEMFNPVHVL